MDQRVVIPYKPRPLQAEIHSRLDKHRWAGLVLHRRFGKTVMLENQLIKRAMLCDKPRPRFAYVAPYLKQAKTVAWDYLKYYTKNIPHREINESELRINFPSINDSQIRLFGSDNPDALRGIYLDGVVFDEYQDSDPRVFTSILRPALSDRQGWAVFSGTPNGRNHFYDMINDNADSLDWYIRVLKASETGVLAQEELDDARRIMSPEEYEREYECSFDNAIIGSYYGTQLNDAVKDGRVCNVPYDPALPVITAWDLGVGDSTAIWFVQKFQKEIRVIDYFEASGEGMAFYAKELTQRPYTYEQHIMPHDIRVRELGTGKSRYETALSLGIKPITIAKSLPVDDGIQAVRNILPMCWFDKKKTEQGRAALQDYHKEYDELRKEYKNRPYHDWTSHGADSFRMFAVGYSEPKKARPVSDIMNSYNFAGAW